MAEVWPEIADKLAPILEEVYRTGQPYEMENSPFRMLRSAGYEEDYFTFSFTPIHNGAGLLEGIMALASETTEKVRAEMNLEKYAARLQRSNQELEQFEFIASHDLQEPLRKIQAFGRRVMERLHGRSEYEGTGMGLAICRKIIERHHGTITAHSQSGQGATFVIEIPRKLIGNTL
jgi:signal transduction histidine kinase